MVKIEKLSQKKVTLGILCRLKNEPKYQLNFHIQLSYSLLKNVYLTAFNMN